MKIRNFIIVVLYFSLSALSGCGGSGGGGDTSAILSGMASKGPIQGGTVKVYAMSSGVTDTSAPIGQGQTDADGNYTIDLGQYAGPVMAEVTGGTFTDEVSGATVNLNTSLRAIIPGIPTGSAIAAVTPLTELAFRNAKGVGPLTAASINAANARVAATFGLADIVSTLPAPNSGTDAQKKYAAACGAFSQLINDNEGPGESAGEALTRILGQMGDEEERNGKLSTDSTVLINKAIAGFNSSVNNQTGATLAALSTPAGGQLKLSVAGTAAMIAGIDVTVNLPDGAVVNADPVTGEVAAGVVTISGVAAAGSNHLVAAKYSPASNGGSAQLHIALINNLGFQTGEYATVQFTVTTSANFPLSSAFTTASFSAKGLDGSGLAGVTAAPPSLQGI